MAHLVMRRLEKLRRDWEVCIEETALPCNTSNESIGPGFDGTDLEVFTWIDGLKSYAVDL